MGRPHRLACRCAGPESLLARVRRALPISRSIPFEGSLPPLIDKTDCQYRKENHHRPEAIKTDFSEGDCPREKEADLEVEDDEENGHQVETHVKFHARVVKRIEPAFISGKL